MDDVTIDVGQFRRRLRRLKDAWTWPLDGIVVLLGKSDDTAGEFKSSAMHFWLFGIEFPETVVCLMKSGKVFLLTSPKKLEYLRQIEGPEVVLMARAPGNAEQQQFKTFADAVREGREKVTVGTLLKEKHVGAFTEAFGAALPSLPGLQVVECKEELATLLAAKEEVELELVRKSALCAHNMQSVFLKNLEDTIDGCINTTNRKLCEELEQQLDNQDLMRSWESKLDIDTSEMDIVYASLQSGSSFEIKPAMPATSEKVPESGTFLVSIGVKYAEYSSCLARTLFVDPTQIQKEAYSTLLEVHQLVVDSLKPGAVFKDVYLAARRLVQEQRPALVDKFAKNVGFVTGLEFRDALLMINDKCERRVAPGMVFCVSVGFSDPGLPKWAAWVADTVIVPLDASKPCEVPTSASTKLVADVMFELGPETEPQAAAPAPPPPAPAPSKATKQQDEKRPATRGAAKAKPAPAPAAPQTRSSRSSGAERAKRHSSASASKGEEQRRARQEERPSRPATVDSKNIVERRTRARNVQTKQDMSEQARLEEQQVTLRRQKLEELRQRLGSGTGVGAGAGKAAARKLHELQAYAESNELPPVRPNRVQLDPDAEALLVPIRGAVVPFHVSTIKNMARSTMERFEFLRVNFFTPGQGKGAEDFPQVSGTRIYVKELSFRSQSKENFDAILRNFKEVQKRARQRELEVEVRRSSSSTQERPPLQLRKPAPTLRDLNMRPTFGTNSRRAIGNLEAHANGFRFSMKGGAEKVDILYSQIRHAIYEPCEKGSLIVLIHLHLKEPMMVGRKKTQDVQFFTEVAALTEDLSLRKAGSAHDPDEIMEEQREREMKERLNKIFLDFSREVEKISSFPLAFDIPSKPLSFSGVPYKQMVTLSPCKDALVALQEWPPFCLSLTDVDIVVFERAIMTLREFDIVFVKKDYNESPIRIVTIPQTNLDTIKRWLGDIQATWYSCSMSMQWPMVMKEIARDPKEFVENGGWDAWFAGTAASDSGEEECDDESDYKDSEAEDESDAGGDDDDEDFSVDADQESSDFDDDEDDEDGMSWDELEREAERDDRKRDLDRGGGGGRERSGRSQPPRKSARKR